MSGGGSPEHLEELLQLIYLNFTGPRFRPEAYEDMDIDTLPTGPAPDEE